MNSVFEKLDSVDVSKKAEKKGRFTYLSWAWAVRELLRIAPDSTWIVHEWGVKGNKQPYMQTQAGCFVKVSLTVDGITREQVHPVLDNRNQPIKEPNAFEINTSIQRCLAKAIALHGLGLYIFAGEDLPDNTFKKLNEIRTSTIKYMTSESYYDTHWNEFLSYTKNLDKIRNENLLDIEPMFQEYI